ncbi:MAG TPA: deoxyribonuclease IV [Beutenbergiaceae bacterium]|nr:deoxyribonuclease IV [Beutenbergiaceae bacterium]
MWAKRAAIWQAEIMTSFPVGTHVSAETAIDDAQARGAQVIQIMIGKPTAWKGHELAFPGGSEALKDAAGEAGIGIYVHSPYILNVASINNRVRIPSRKLLQSQLDLAAEIDALGLIVHGGHVGDAELEVGYDNWRKALDAVDMHVPILIENTASGDGAVARGVERISHLWQAVLAGDDGARVGFCLDTCHAWASGEDLPGLAERVREATGRIDLLHLNDSRDAQGSGADRHANLGKGQIPEDDLRAVVKEAQAPIILETPGGLDEHVADMAWVSQTLNT